MSADQTYTRRSPLKRALLSATLLMGALGCAEGSGDSSGERGSANLAKGDITVGPIEQISCALDKSFVRRGGFASLKVEALDSEGGKSRNYQLIPKPSAGARVVQRDQVIFDLDGHYSVQCCALDTGLCDQVAVQVGESAPALSVSVEPFNTERITLKGHAVDRLGAPAQVTVNGAPVSSDGAGRFEVTAVSETGLNRFEVTATDGEGESSVRHAWTIGGPFNDVDAIDPGALRLRLSEASYPPISRVLTEYFILLAGEFSESDQFRVTQVGSSLGFDWEVTPQRLTIGAPELRLASGEHDQELSLLVKLDQFRVEADGRTRFGGGDWRDREVSVTADLSISVTFKPHERGFEIVQVESEVDNLQVEISDMPGFIEGILEWIFEGSIRSELVNLAESVSDQGLSNILTRFEVNERLTLPEPLSGELSISGRVSEFEVDEAGVVLGVGLAIDGETDPARVKAPGPLLSSDELPKLNQGAPYELAFHLDLLNRLFFSAWQTGGLDAVVTVDQPFGPDDEILGDQRLTLFITPDLPPVARMGAREGELLIELGALQVDGVLESDLGVLNCALEVGASLRALMSGGERALFVSSALEQISADVLIAPAGWEKEPTRELVARIIETDVAPKYLDLLSTLPIPSADLSQLNLQSVRALATEELSVSTSYNSLTVGATIELR